MQAASAQPSEPVPHHIIRQPPHSLANHPRSSLETNSAFTHPTCGESGTQRRLCRSISRSTAGLILTTPSWECSPRPTMKTTLAAPLCFALSRALRVGVAGGGGQCCSREAPLDQSPTFSPNEPLQRHDISASLSVYAGRGPLRQEVWLPDDTTYDTNKGMHAVMGHGTQSMRG